MRCKCEECACEEGVHVRRCGCMEGVGVNRCMCEEVYV